MSDEQYDFRTVGAIFIVKNRETGKWEGQGKTDFAVLPRVGEHVEIDRDGIGTMTRVVMVLHPRIPTGNVDLYAVEVGPTTDYLSRLRSKNHPAGLSKTERLILWNQYHLLSKLDPDGVKFYTERCEVLERGYSLFYDSEHIDPAEVGEDDCREVIQIMQMFRALHDGYKGLSDKSGIDQNQVRFDGFDGNEETPLMAFTRFLVHTQGKFQELKEGTRDDFNSHMPRLDRYRRMRRAWERSQEKFALSRDDIVRIINALWEATGERMTGPPWVAAGAIGGTSTGVVTAAPDDQTRTRRV